MSIMDAKHVFCKNLSLGLGASTDTALTQHAATNTLDLGASDLDVGAGTPLYLNVLIGTAPAGYKTSGDSTCSFKLQGANTLSAFTGPCYNVLWTPMKKLTANTRVMCVPLAYGINHKHLRLKFVTNATTANTWSAATQGSFSGWISSAVPDSDVGT